MKENIGKFEHVLEEGGGGFLSLERLKLFKKDMLHKNIFLFSNQIACEIKCNEFLIFFFFVYIKIKQ